MPVIVADAMRPDRTPEEEEKQEKEGKVRLSSPFPWLDVLSRFGRGYSRCGTSLLVRLPGVYAVGFPFPLGS